MAKVLRYVCGCIVASTLSLSALTGAELSPEEISQMEAGLGITLSAEQKTQIASIVKPEGSLPQWRVDAEARIEEARKSYLQVEVVDQFGFPIEGAEVEVKLRSNSFRFGGVMSVKDFSDENNLLEISTDRYRELFLSLFNAGGLDNGLKMKQRAGNEALLPGFFEWAEENKLPVRGHLLIWPGRDDANNHLPADLLGDVRAVEAAIEGQEPQATIDALKATLKTNVDASIAEWASKWPVYEWDVINETLSNFRIQNLLGDGEMAEWFKIGAGNVVLPDCNLLLNEFQIISANSQTSGSQGYQNRSARFKANIDRILADGGPLNKIGFQSRFKFEHPDPAIIYNRLEDFDSTYGLMMTGTEFEIRDNPSGSFRYDFTEFERAQITEEILTTYYSHPGVDGLFAWTYMKPEEFSMCYYDGTVKLNALVWYYLHRIRYHSESTQNTDTMGRMQTHAFDGIYDVNVRIGATKFSSEFLLDKDKTHRIEVNLDDSGPRWGMFPVIQDRYADTDLWLGLLQVDTAPWVWSFDLEAWLYIPIESADAGIGWTYFPDV